MMEPLRKLTLFLFVVMVGSAHAMDSIRESDLSPIEHLDKAFFRKTNPGISDQAFNEKWGKVLQETPLKFFRSFVPSYYADLKDLKELGSIGACFGDAHPENFGFLQFKDGVHYVYNDFDDSGYCPVALEALRYFTAWRLSDENEERLESLVGLYVDVFDDAAKAEKLPGTLFPNFEQIRKKHLEEYISEDSFTLKSHHGLKALESRLKKELIEALAKEPLFTGDAIVDAVSYIKEDGGSGGLQRYWLLVKKPNGQRDILELKQLATPATSVGKWGPLPMDRIGWAKKEFWKDLVSAYFQTLAFQSTEFLVRSRTQGHLVLEDYKHKERLEIYRAQLSLLALQHRKVEKPREHYRHWLIDSSKTLEKRYRTAFENAKAHR